MSKSVQINIPKPCHENWQNMTTQEQGRFCGSCQQTVVDFTAMTDKELLNYISNAAGQHTCGRFSKDQLNRKINVPEKSRSFSLAYIWNLLLAFFLITESNAQTAQQNKKKPQVQLPNASPTIGTVAVMEYDTVPSKEIVGIILSNTSKEPLAGVTVMVKGTSLGVVTDEKGKFKLMVKNKGAITLEVTYLGYKMQTVVLTNKQKGQKVRVLLEEDEMALMGKYGYIHFDH